MSENTEQNYNLDDTVIAQIAKIIQVAILSGTDITDNLRQMSLSVNEEGKLGLSKEYVDIFNTNIDKMTQKASMEQMKLF
tara:strand:+ start:601 stop:840 length:240 start_codon:yes stop_codon:yes gene_type:complete